MAMISAKSRKTSAKVVATLKEGIVRLLLVPMADAMERNVSATLMLQIQLQAAANDMQVLRHCGV